MINGKKILAVIPARGGSKGVPRKNIRNFFGKPLIAWTLEEAKKSKYIDRVIVSSEDDEIINVAKKFGGDVPYIRPKQLATDFSSGIDPVLHAIEEIPEYDYIILLQTTSPLRIVEDIDKCIEKMIRNNVPACVSVSKTEKSPTWMFSLENNNLLNPLIKNTNNSARRQDLPEFYNLNGAIYIAEKEWLTAKKTFLTSETIAYIMPQNRSYDIDTENDFIICEFLMSKRYN